MKREYFAMVEEEIAKCMRCGNCQAVCPLYQETHGEWNVARGKVRLAKAVLQGELPWTRALAARFDMCLTCLACVANCPCGVRVDRVVLAARAVAAEEQGLSRGKRAANFVLGRPRLMKTGTRVAAAGQKLAFRHGQDGISPRFPLGLEKRRIFPPLAGRAFLDQLADRREATSPGTGKRIALFAGCLGNYVYPDTPLAALRLLEATGADVIVPMGQHCCGFPVLSSGDRATAAAMARSHVALFSGLACDAVVTLCGTCGEAFACFYPELLAGDPEWADPARDLAARTLDIAAYLVETGLPHGRAATGENRIRVTYHEPCHLCRGMGVSREPVALLSACPGLEFVPMRDQARCCGGAGFFSLHAYDLSVRVRQHKMDAVKEAGVETVVTGCSACRMHLNEGLVQAGLPQRATHTAEALAAALGLIGEGSL